MVGATEARASDVRVELQAGDEVLAASAENIDLTLEAYQATGQDLALAGSLVVTLTPGPAGELVISPEEGVTVDGNFQATIPASSEPS